MTKMNIVINDAVEEKFRKTVYQRLGMKKGNLSKAFEEAMQDWIKK